MKTEDTARASELQETIRRLALAAPPHLAEGNALLRRCRDLHKRTPGSTDLVRAAARILTADAALGRALHGAVRRSKRKANIDRLQRLEAKIAELNSLSALFKKGGR
jgi:hypothetical protein